MAPTEIGHGGIEATDAARRMLLLARKYAAASVSREDAARLEILNERLRHVHQRVRDEDLAALEEAAANLERSRAMRKELAEKYGIKSR